MKRFALIILLLAACVAWLAWQHTSRRSVRKEGGELAVFCAAGLKPPFERAAAEYRREMGVEIQSQYGGTGSLFSAMKVTGKGDLFVAADQGAIDDARKLGLIREVIPLITQRPVLAVRAGNPKGLRSLDDLAKEGVRYAAANPESASIGRIVRKTLGDRWEKFAAGAAVLKPTVMDIANDLSIGAVDAAIVWDSAAAQFAGIEAVDLPEFQGASENASIAVLAASTQPTAALRFARYLSAPEKGGKIFAAQKYRPVVGDAWAPRPSLVLYSGGVNRPAIQVTLKEFADREGVDLTTVFNGCGILCASMRAMSDQPGAKIPDAYYACDVCFVPPVADLYPQSVYLTETDIVIAVQEGNPRGIRTLADLAQPGLKVGLCNAQQSTLGYMTRAMLKESGLLDGVMKNVVSQVPTADFLVNQLRAGSLDAAVTYIVNVNPVAEHLDALPIKHAGAKAVQPFSVAGSSPNRLLAYRLLDCLKANRERFEEAGFRWRGDEPPVASKDIEVPDFLKPKND